MTAFYKTPIDKKEHVFINKLAFKDCEKLPDYFVSKTGVIHNKKARVFDHSNYFISERIRKEFEKNNVTGIRCIPIPKTSVV